MRARRRDDRRRGVARPPASSTLDHRPRALAQARRTRVGRGRRLEPVLAATSPDDADDRERREVAVHVAELDRSCRAGPAPGQRVSASDCADHARRAGRRAASWSSNRPAADERDAEDARSSPRSRDRIRRPRADPSARKSASQALGVTGSPSSAISAKSPSVWPPSSGRPLAAPTCRTPGTVREPLEQRRVEARAGAAFALASLAHGSATSIASTLRPRESPGSTPSSLHQSCGSNEPRADQQHERERDLRHDDAPADTLAQPPEPACPRPPFHQLSHVLQAVRARARVERRASRTQQRQQRAKTEHRAGFTTLFEPRQSGGSQATTVRRRPESAPGAAEARRHSRTASTSVRS